MTPIKKPQPGLALDDLEIDDLMGQLDSRRKLETFANVDLRHGEWKLRIKFSNEIEEKRKLYEILKYCKAQNISYRGIERNDLFYVMEFMANPEAKIMVLPPEIAQILNGYLIQQK